ncbi:Aste57867_25030 [Aphanomyces stellatus]|uniref:Aste57867_25030 protein n=1 Tax=Aphanomyces stellatus TaxID=120398 RepID=A0A485LTF2_9STRA|nr:hypothetical protein As57867_024952 [Aphanomyces stellatus]VFU01661.1 Aste57867_25030 [Aphanomyces stellatus]
MSPSTKMTSSRTSMAASKNLPLPRDFFRRPPLTTADIDRLNAFSKQVSTDVAVQARIDSHCGVDDDDDDDDRTGIRWHLDVDEPGLKMYMGDNPVAPPGTSTYCGVTEVLGTLDEIASHFRAESAGHMSAKQVLDDHTLYTFATPTPDYPRHLMRARWFVVDTPVKGLGIVANRDFCVLESHHDVEIDGRRGWVRSLQSIELVCCPPLTSVIGFVRGTMYRSGLVALETDRPGVLHVTQLYQFDLHLQAPLWLTKLGMRSRCRDIVNIDLFLRAARLGGTFLADHQLVPKDLRTNCYVCHKSFCLFLLKTHCLKCGEVVCRHCSKMWDVHVLLPPPSKSMEKPATATAARRICTHCALSTAALTSATPSSSSSTASSSSPRGGAAQQRNSSRSADHLICGRFLPDDDPVVVRIRAVSADVVDDCSSFVQTFPGRRAMSCYAESDDEDDDGWTT